MTSNNSFNTQPNTFEKTKFNNWFFSIFRTSRKKSTIIS
jgi:hypothetical protein